MLEGGIEFSISVLGVIVSASNHHTTTTTTTTKSKADPILPSFTTTNHDHIVVSIRCFVEKYVAFAISLLDPSQHGHSFVTRNDYWMTTRLVVVIVTTVIYHHHKNANLVPDNDDDETTVVGPGNPMSFHLFLCELWSHY
jgi:hypothetical protein